MASGGGKLRLEIQFGEKTPAYRSGRDLTGTVMLDVHSGHLHATRFYVECLGYSEVHQAESSGGHRKLRRDILSLKQCLLSTHQMLESRRFDFRFRLPGGLPHSVESDDVGFVRYCCRAVVFLEGADPMETVGYFSLIEEVDLNSQLVQAVCRPSEKVSASVVERMPCSGKTGKDEVKAALVLAKGAYVPGENVDCTLSVHSAACGIQNEQAYVRLVQTVTVRGENGRQTAGGAVRREVIAQHQVESDEQYSEHYWSARCQMHIRGAVASTLLSERCQHPLIVSYVVEMSVGLALAASPTKEVTVSCPVLIGTVPLQEAPGKAHPATVHSSVVEVSRCVISETDHSLVKEKPDRRTGSILEQLMPNRRKSSYRAAPPIQYTLYCIYYPTISIPGQQKSLKSILKRHSVDNLEAAGGGNTKEQLQVTHRTASISLYETPL